MPKKMIVVLLLLATAGCGIIPDLGAPPQPRADLLARSHGEANGGASPVLPAPQAWWRFYQDPQLDGLIEEALRQSPTVAEAAARLRKAQAMAEVSGARLYPSLDFNGTYSKMRQSYNEGVPASFVPHGFQDSTEATLNFGYEVDFWGKNRDSLAASLLQAEAAQLNLAQARLILSTSIASTYAQLAQLYAEQDAAQESVSVHDKTAELFQKRFDHGLENQGGVEQAKVSRAAAAAEVAELDESIALARNSLAALVGNPEVAAQVVRPNIQLSDKAEPPRTLHADLLSRRPDVAAALRQVEAAAKQINVAKAGFYPNISLSAYVGHQALTADMFLSPGSLIAAFGPAVTLPLFKGGQLEGQYRGARADYDTSVAQYEAAMVQALHEVADANTSRAALGVRTRKTIAQLRAAERAYDVTNNRYRGGLATYLEVLRAEDNLITSRRAMADIRSRAFVVEVMLIKALGGGFRE